MVKYPKTTMMATVVHLLCGAVEGFSASPGAAERYFGADRAALFDSYLRDIKDGNAGAVQASVRLGVDFDAEAARARERFASARSGEDSYYALLSLRNLLRDPHAYFRVPDGIVPSGPVLSVPLKLKPLRADVGAPVIVAGEGIPGVPAGAELLKYNGKSLRKAAHEYLQWHDDASVNSFAFNFTDWLLRRDPLEHPAFAREPLSFIFSGPGGDAVEISLFPSEEERPDSAATAPDDYGTLKLEDSGVFYKLYSAPGSGLLVLHYASFLYQGEGEDKGSSEALEAEDTERLRVRLDRPGIDALLIDLRFNPGGQFPYGLLSLLAGREARLPFRRFAYTPLVLNDPEFRRAFFSRGVSPRMAADIERDSVSGAEFSRAFAFDCRDEACGVRPFSPGPAAEDKLKFPVYALSGPGCASSCEQFLSVFRSNGLGRTAGLASRGSSAPFSAWRRFKLADGSEFLLRFKGGVSYAPDGVPIESDGSAPDLHVFPQSGDWLRELIAAVKADISGREGTVLDRTVGE
jgi:hypothetical protein